MSIAFDAKADRPAALNRGPSVPWRAVSVAVLPDYCLRVRFLDGLEGTVEMMDLVSSPGAGVFSALRDPDLFAKAQIVLGAVTWPGDLDLAPDAMYDEIRVHGVWRLAGRQAS